MIEVAELTVPAATPTGVSLSFWAWSFCCCDVMLVSVVSPSRVLERAHGKNRCGLNKCAGDAGAES